MSICFGGQECRCDKKSGFFDKKISENDKNVVRGDGTIFIKFSNCSLSVFVFFSRNAKGPQPSGQRIPMGANEFSDPNWQMAAKPYFEKVQVTLRVRRISKVVVALRVRTAS